MKLNAAALFLLKASSAAAAPGYDDDRSGGQVVPPSNHLRSPAAASSAVSVATDHGGMDGLTPLKTSTFEHPPFAMGAENYQSNVSPGTCQPTCSNEWRHYLAPLSDGTPYTCVGQGYCRGQNGNEKFAKFQFNDDMFENSIESVKSCANMCAYVNSERIPPRYKNQHVGFEFDIRIGTCNCLYAGIARDEIISIWNNGAFSRGLIFGDDNVKGGIASANGSCLSVCYRYDQCAEVSFIEGGVEQWTDSRRAQPDAELGYSCFGVGWCKDGSGRGYDSLLVSPFSGFKSQMECAMKCASIVPNREFRRGFEFISSQRTSCFCLYDDGNVPQEVPYSKRNGHSGTGPVKDTDGDGQAVCFTYEKPLTNAPTKAPTKTPTKSPTKTPTKAPTKTPTKAPTKTPTKSPTKTPTKLPTDAPSVSAVPSTAPSVSLEPSPFPTRPSVCIDVEGWRSMFGNCSHYEPIMESQGNCTNGIGQYDYYDYQNHWTPDETLNQMTVDKACCTCGGGILCIDNTDDENEAETARCAFLNSNPEDCDSEDNQDLKDKCCACGGGTRFFDGNQVTPRPTPMPTPPPTTPVPSAAPSPPPTEPFGTPCDDSPGWTDPFGADCAWYQANDDQGCPFHGPYSVDFFGGGESAYDACCWCKGDSTGNSGDDCTDFEGWTDAWGFNCAFYTMWPDDCTMYGNDVGADGKTANQACCACGGGGNPSSKEDGTIKKTLTAQK